MIARTRPRLHLAPIALAFACLGSVGSAAGAQGGPTTSYVVRLPEPEHHWLEVDVTFRELGTAPLRARMSRSSPGRYAVHEFAKNVFALEAFDGAGRRLRTLRPDVDEWRVEGHDGTVRVVYRIFGDHADGTYMAVDTTHAHLNMPATFLWAVGLDQRPIEIRFVPPAESGWRVGSQLFATSDPFVFRAPNLQYFMDSPTELAALLESTFTVPEAGRDVRFRLLAHTDATQADVDALAVLVRRMVVEARAVYGAFPTFDPGHYTFLLDYVPWAEDDAMEHRNSTYVSDPGVSLRTPAGRASTLVTLAHEFFHVWNVERIRPEGLEPFDFTRENITCCLWLAEGFTQYYGPLIVRRAGLSASMSLDAVSAVLSDPARHVRSPVEMSQHGPFDDAAVAVDVHDRHRTFISYYTYGAAIAVALDFDIRQRTASRLSLDDFMRRLWTRFGVAAAPPGHVAQAYTLADLRHELGELVADHPFAGAFFDRHIEGREPADYGRLLALAGYSLQPAAPGRGWAGNVAVEDSGRGLLVGGGPYASQNVVPLGTPAYRAGLDRGDVILAIDGQPATIATWNGLGRRSPGDRVRLEIERRDRRRATVELVLDADPTLVIVPAERTGQLEEAARAFREAWLASRVN